MAGAFEGLGEDALARLCVAAELVELPAGAVLASEGDPADGAYVVAEGSIQLGIHQREAELTVATVGAGELLGWSWMIEPHRWSFDVSSSGGARLVRIPTAALESLMVEDPAEGVALGRILLAVVSRRLRDTRVQLLDVLAPSPGGRPSGGHVRSTDDGGAG